MLKYKRISNINGVARYEYYPDGDTTSPGIIEFENDDQPKLIQESKKDVKMYFALHAMNDIDVSKESGTIAWY